MASVTLAELSVESVAVAGPGAELLQLLPVQVTLEDGWAESTDDDLRQPPEAPAVTARQADPVENRQRAVCPVANELLAREASVGPGARIHCAAIAVEPAALHLTSSSPQ